MTAVAATAGLNARLPLEPARLAAFVTCTPGHATREVLSPINNAPIGTLPVSTITDVITATNSARTLQRTWSTLSVKTRAHIFHRFANLVLDHVEDICDVIQLETGKSRLSAFEEVIDTARTAAFYAHASARMLRTRRRVGALPILTKTIETWQPKGVVAIISPWNYPFTLALSDAIPALIAGNTVVLKPDSQTPFTALYGLWLLHEAGLPKEAFQVVVGSGAKLGDPLIIGSDYLMFTGSTDTGRVVAQACARRLIGFSAELGGKNPLLVLADADVEKAAAGAVRACFSNSGQLCVSTERLYVHTDVYDAFVSAFVARTKAMRLGVGFDWSTDMGSLASPSQLKTIKAHVHDAVSQGATVLAGGKARPDLGPNFFEPTILTDVTDDMILHRDETFGPVVSVYRVDSDAAAVMCANDTRYGLNASVWSRRRGQWAARRIHAGTVNINEGYSATWASHGAPMGGMGDSGVGRRHGREGIAKYTESQTISTQRLVPIGPFGSLDARSWMKMLTASVRILNRIL